MVLLLQGEMALNQTVAKHDECSNMFKLNLVTVHSHLGKGPKLNHPRLQMLFEPLFRPATHHLGPSLLPPLSGWTSKALFLKAILISSKVASEFTCSTSYKDCETMELNQNAKTREKDLGFGFRAF